MDFDTVLSGNYIQQNSVECYDKDKNKLGSLFLKLIVKARYTIFINGTQPQSYIFLVQVRLRTVLSTMHPKFDLTGVQTHDLQIITVQFMSLRRLL